MFRELIAIIEKNFKRLLRSKISSLIILIGPLILIAIIGLAFNSSGIYGIVIGVYSEENSNITQTIISSLENKEFSIDEFDTEQGCIDSVADGNSHICIVFPEIIDDENKIEFHVDYSRINLVFTLIEILSAKLTGQSKAMSLGMMYSLVDKIRFAAYGLKESTAIVDELKLGAEELGIKIVGVKGDIQDLNIDFDINQLNLSAIKDDIGTNKQVLASYESQINKQIRNNKEKLEQFKGDAVELKAYVDEKREQQENIKVNVDESYDAQGCGTKTVVDLSPYLEDSEELNNQIESLESPTCSFLYTIKKNVDETGEQLDSTSSKLKLLIESIDEAIEDLEDFEKETDTLFEQANIAVLNAERKFNSINSSITDAENKVNNLEKTKKGFSSELDLISSLVNNNLVKFDDINSAMSSLIESMEEISFVDPEKVVSPISTEIKPLTVNKKTLDYFFPSLLVLVVMFVSILLSSSLVMRERESNATFRNLIAPVNNYIYVFGTYLTTLIITIMQTLILTIIASLFFSITIFHNILPLAVTILLIITVFSSIGIIISNLFKSEETATIASIITACILFLFSSLIVPLEKMSSGMRIIAKFNPFVVSEFVLNKILLFDKTLSGISGDLSILIIQAVILCSLAVLSFKAFKYEYEEE